MSLKNTYRIIFHSQEDIYEIYARSISESEMFGFMEVEEFVFGETTALVIDPAEERLQLEFSDVKRTYIPMQNIIRIDEVKKEGVAKIKESSTVDNKVRQFPVSKMPRPERES